mgnify:CR=1 FL=1
MKHQAVNPQAFVAWVSSGMFVVDGEVVPISALRSDAVMFRRAQETFIASTTPAAAAKVPGKKTRNQAEILVLVRGGIVVQGGCDNTQVPKADLGSKLMTLALMEGHDLDDLSVITIVSTGEGCTVSCSKADLIGLLSTYAELYGSADGSEGGAEETVEE